MTEGQGRGNSCVRCGRSALAHDLAPLDICLSYVRLAPLRIRLLNRVLAAILGRINR
jgi:hypothetical protein